MKKSELLKLTLEQVIDETSKIDDNNKLNRKLNLASCWQNAFVCNILNTIASNHPHNYATVMELKHWIGTLLGTSQLTGPHTYNSWVRGHYPKIAKKMDKKHAFNEGRIQWVTWMIKYWEEQGD